MRRLHAIWLATTIAAVIGLASFFLAGQSPAGLGSAARNTARFSGIVFALALAARSPRFLALFADRWSIFFAFIAAHGVHFSAVAALAIFDTAHPLHRMDPPAIMTLAGGFTLVLLAAITAGKADAPFRSRIHTFFFYVLAVVFAVAFGSRAMHAPASAAALLALLAGVAVRVLPVSPVSAAATSQT